MALYNMPTYNTSHLRIGQAVAFISTAAGATPTTHIGAIADHSFQPSWSEAVLYQGSPEMAITSDVTREEGILTIAAKQHTMRNIADAMGNASEITTWGTGLGKNSMGWGGNPTKNVRSLQIVHRAPRDGSTYTFKFWRCEAIEPPAFDFPANEHAIILMKFRVLYSATTWWGTDSLSSVVAGGNKAGRLFWLEKDGGSADSA